LNGCRNHVREGAPPIVGCHKPGPQEDPKGHEAPTKPNNGYSADSADPIATAIPAKIIPVSPGTIRDVIVPPRARYFAAVLFLKR